MLIHRTRPTSIALVILLCSSILNKITEVHELLGVNLIRVCCTYTHRLCTIIADYHLFKAKELGQLSSDGTSRWQVALQNLLLSFPDGGIFKSLILSMSTILKYDLSETKFN